MRFEHCYRLDLDLAIAPSHREACWRQWLRSYTYGQPRDRTEYARQRVRAFVAGDVSRPTLRLATEPSASADKRFYLVSPSPTSAHAPPPPIATRVYVDDKPQPVASASATPSPTPPGARCAADCEGSFRSCQAACAPAGGASETACRSCEPDYRACMKRCFE